jgi:tetratricopeptide (TPR) repeat protein
MVFEKKNKLKMKIMKKQILIVTALMFVFFGINAQNWPTDPEKRSKAETNYSLLTDYSKQNDFANAVTPLRWILANTPDLHNSIYVNGAKVYEGLVDKATGDQKKGLQDTAMLMYDLRIKYFGDEANVLNRKGLKAWTYWNDRPEKVNELYDLYKKIAETSKEKSFSVVTYALMDLSCKRKTKGELTDDQVIDNYEMLSEMADNVIAAGGAKAEEWQKAKEQLDNTLPTCVKVDCNFVLNNMGPKFKDNPADLVIAKKIFALMRSGGCTKEPLFIEAAERINEKEPSTGMAMTIARFAESAEDLNKALKFYKIVTEIAKDNEAKGNAFIRMAAIYSKQGQKVTARDYARKSLALDAGRKDALILIGDLYFGSYNDCKTNNEIIARACYIAAYEMYDKAGDGNKKAMAKAQFPTMEQIFTYAMKEGDPIQTGCWINETVVLRKR